MARRKASVNNRVIRCTWSIKPGTVIKLQHIIESINPDNSGADSATVDQMINAVYSVLVRRGVVDSTDQALLDRVKAKLERNKQFTQDREFIDPTVRDTDWLIAKENSFFRGKITDDDLQEVTPAEPCPN